MNAGLARASAGVICVDTVSTSPVAGKGIVFGLVRVGSVVKDALQAVLDCPDLSYRQ